MVPSSTTSVLPSPADPPIPIRKGTCFSRNPHPFILSYLIIVYLYHILFLFPQFLFLFLTLYMRSSLIRSGNRQWLKKWLLCILLTHGNLVPSPAGKSLIGCRWVYTVKIGLDGRVDRLKAHLVAIENHKIFYGLSLSFLVHYFPFFLYFLCFLFMPS